MLLYGYESSSIKKENIYFLVKIHLRLLKEIDMLGCKLASTPMKPKKKLGREEVGVLVDKERYKRLVGKLIYLSHT